MTFLLVNRRSSRVALLGLGGIRRQRLLAATDGLTWSPDQAIPVLEGSSGKAVGFRLDEKHPLREYEPAHGARLVTTCMLGRNPLLGDYRSSGLQKGVCHKMPSNGTVIDRPDRAFYLELLRGGMNRLLLRSDKNSTAPKRIEILFMSVKYMAIGTLFEGLTIQDVGPLTDSDAMVWRIEPDAELHRYLVASSSGNGLIVAGGYAVEETDAEPHDPSGFFMMS